MHTKNALDIVRATIYERKLIPVGPIQAYQSDELMRHFREDIIEKLSVLRREKIDPRARNDLQEQGVDPDKYPIGFCGWIRDAVMSVLPQISENLELQGSIQLSRVRFRKIWVIQHEKYMQNAIQAGAWIIDAANDTCDRNKPPVVIERIEDSGMRNRRDHADFCSVLEKYWRVQPYPNIYYPALAPFFPVIFSFQGKIGFLSSQTKALDASGILDNFTSAGDFIFDSDFSERRLSDQEQTQLKNIPGGHRVCLTSQNTLRNVRRIFKKVKMYGPNKLAEIYAGFFLHIKQSKMELDI